MFSVISEPVAVLWGKQGYVYEEKYQNITVTICEKSGYFIDGNLPFLLLLELIWHLLHVSNVSYMF